MRFSSWKNQPWRRNNINLPMDIARKKFYKRLDRPIGVFSLERRWQDVLHDKKWKKFIKMGRLFAFIPFVNFSLASGSMALGNVHENSDFDVVVGCKYGRIFTARFFCIVAFSVFGWRRGKLTHKEEAADKICFNHFVTEKSFCLHPEYNIYWQELYKNLVPIFGGRDIIRAFFRANDWLDQPIDYFDDSRHIHKKSSFLKKAAEYFLGGRLGDWVESILKKGQMERIKNNLKSEELGFGPRIRYSDEELEFHPDTARIVKLTRGLH